MFAGAGQAIHGMTDHGHTAAYLGLTRATTINLRY